MKHASHPTNVHPNIRLTNSNAPLLERPRLIPISARRCGCWRSLGILEGWQRLDCRLRAGRAALAYLKTVRHGRDRWRESQHVITAPNRHSDPLANLRSHHCQEQVACPYDRLTVMEFDNVAAPDPDCFGHPPDVRLATSAPSAAGRSKLSAMSRNFLDMHAKPATSGPSDAPFSC